MVTISITEEVAYRVAAMITRQGMKKNYIAKAVGIPPTTFKRKIDGFTDFTVSEIDRIARVLGIAPAELLPQSMRTAA
ncbi:helix-turn-helix domain-containing protein [Leifsonia xyli]|uniref:helix-turn-helix domain-containing protein n=1 Tax=Leifsonia xyli TaxID=1575 RepID=UPI0005C4685F|nr:helix-turn-helix transcriptional regulator [Leifsonia xyli]